jgi:hypothetical protein
MFSSGQDHDDSLNLEGKQSAADTDLRKTLNTFPKKPWTFSLHISDVHVFQGAGESSCDELGGIATFKKRLLRWMEDLTFYGV